jgi:hypothetical protein
MPISNHFGLRGLELASPKTADGSPSASPVERHLFPSVQLSSRAGLGWKDIIVGRYLAEPGEGGSGHARHFLAEASGQEMCFGERRGVHGCSFDRYLA